MQNPELIPGMIVQPTTPWLRSMRQCGGLLPFDGVLVAINGPFYSVLWNNAEGHIMSVKKDALRPSKGAGRKEVTPGELSALVADLEKQLDD